jgi:hypothetical protein
MTVRMPVERLDLSTATRMALTGYVAGVARQVARHNVTINNLLPGTIMTERIRGLGKTAQDLVDKVPMGRAGSSAEFAAACTFLAGVPGRVHHRAESACRWRSLPDHNLNVFTAATNAAVDAAPASASRRSGWSAPSSTAAR